MSRVAFLFFGLLAGAISKLADGQSEVRNEATGAFTIRSAIDRLRRAQIFPDDHEFLRRLAWILTKDGGDPNTFRAGYYGGIWQVDRADFFRTQTDPVAIRNYHPKILRKLNISWPDVRWKDLRKPLYSLIAARLKIALTTSPGECRRPTPTTAPDQASFFSRCYFSGRGSGLATRDPQSFLMAISQCQQALACTTNTF